ncbi:hypothetical protein NHN26_14230 [Rhodovulum tesquicola]|uniref:hypothetical protein n=1 Tax=Rhodovulum tesquicola TaxID=540254 RepID=UPI0020980800|nr:hypothetical protein [Rhodovulum tesquicola]MCO8146382.1 hypothetical protein [Rhodovulum tesquicola]
MYVKDNFKTGTPVTCDPRLAAARHFCNEHGEALVTAAALLGGARWESRALGLLEAMSGADRLTRGLERDLVALHGLLALDHVDDLDSVEAARFAEIHPADPRVEDLCRLTDRLGTLLGEIAGPPSPAAAAAA